jgi:hypothetical protein
MKPTFWYLLHHYWLLLLLFLLSACKYVKFLGFLCCYRLHGTLIDYVLETCFYTYILAEDIKARRLSVKANQRGFKVTLILI